MKLHYKGKYNLDPDSLPKREHMPNAVQFKEAQSMKKLAIIANVLALVITIPLLVLAAVRCGVESTWQMSIGGILSLVLMFPHEIVHALCFKEDVYLYTNFKQGMLFVVGTETMSKARFIFMSMAPNLLFGFVPFAVAMIFPQLALLGYMGAVNIGAGAGDYYNVFNAVRQMPKGSKCYMHGMHTFWYMPE